MKTVIDRGDVVHALSRPLPGQLISNVNAAFSF